MCDVSIIMAVTAGIGAAVTAASTGAQVAAQQQKAAYDEAVQKNNALVAKYKRADILQRGAAAAKQAEITGRRVAEDAYAQTGASGIDPTVGSAHNLLTASAINSGTDADTIRANAARQAWGLGNEEQDLLAGAANSKQAGFLGSLGTGIGGFGQAAGQAAEAGIHVNRYVKGF